MSEWRKCLAGLALAAGVFLLGTSAFTYRRLDRAATIEQARRPGEKNLAVGLTMMMYLPTIVSTAIVGFANVCVGWLIIGIDIVLRDRLR